MVSKKTVNKFFLFLNLLLLIHISFSLALNSRIERQRKAYVNQKKEIQKEKEFINRFFGDHFLIFNAKYLKIDFSINLHL